MSEYCLRWNNHRPNLVTVFSELLTSEALVDVTLATDGHYIRAHKLVLSACSIYFKDLFASSPCKHPIVILKDISIEALKTVIDFIYRGEVTVSQDKLQEVLRTAESLRIKGLTDNPRSYDELPSHGLRNTSSSFGSQATRQRSSLTDSRDQSLSLEGEEDGEPGTPPSSKKRKIASEHDSIESSQDDAETEENNRLGDIKPEPSEDRDNERSLSRETLSEYNLGVSTENSEDNSGAAGPSDSATAQAQGLVCRWGLAGEPPSLEALLGGPPPYVPSGLTSPAPHSPPQHSRLLPPDPPLTHPTTTLLPLPTMQHTSSSYLPTKSWPPQFRRMSPNMLMAIEAVRSGKMGFTQAGKTFNVNGRTLWVYYRKLGYEVHNTFRGKRSKQSVVFDSLNFESGAACLVNNSLKQCSTGGGGTALFDSANSLPIMMPPSPSWFDNVAITLNNSSSNSLMPPEASTGDQPITPVVLSEPPPPKPPSLSTTQSPSSPPHLPSSPVPPPVSTSTSPPPLAPASVEALSAVGTPAAVSVDEANTSPAVTTAATSVLSSASSAYQTTDAADASPTENHVMEESARTLQSLLETYNLRNVWTGAIE